MATIYSEEAKKNDADGRTDFVRVSVRDWVSEKVGGVGDMVIHLQVMIDRKLVIDNREVYNPLTNTNAWFIRMAQAGFDGALANHPARAELQ